MKNFMRSLVSFIVCLMLLLGFAACGDETSQVIQGEKGERGEQGVQGEKGDKGDKGDDGKDGTNGKDGVSPTITIGENGNWYIDSVDTGVKAQGKDGVDGQNGVDGKNGIDGIDGKDGLDGIDGTNGKDGQNGIDGTNGKDGVGIEKVEYDENGDLKITFTDKTTQTIIMPDKHVHTFGEWASFSADETPCESRLFNRVCLSCNSVEWKQGTYEDHTWSVITTSPTCQAQGYDTKTCSICGKVEIENYTQTNEHQWKDSYAFDNSFHWLDCENCDSKSEYAEHDIDGSGYCNVCEQPLLPTEGLVYDVSADGTYAEVIEYTGTATKIKIADTYKSLPVESIYDSVFDGREDIIAVSFPETLKSIGDNAFRQTGLTEITLPENLTNIGKSAFSACRKLATIYFNATECRYLPTSISGYDDWISGAPFAATIGENENEINIFIANNVQYIHSLMFSGGKYMTYGYAPINVYFEEESVCEGIGDDAFYHSALKSINLPSTIKYIGSSAFHYCSLAEIELPNGLTAIEESTFRASGLQKIVIPEGVKYIRRDALAGIPSVELPNSLEVIDEQAFGLDANLQYNEYENCLYVGNKTNPYLLLVKVKNTNYSTYKIHSDTKLILDNAFDNCTRMTTCVIGKNLKYMGIYSDPFPVLSKIYYEGTAQEWANSGLADKSSLKDTEMYYYSEEEPALNSSETDYNGKYWKYGENGEVVVWVFNKE